MKDNFFPSPLSDRLRRVIAESGLPYKTLAQRTGVARASIMRFVRGSQSLRLDMADRLAAYFGLALKEDGKSATHRETLVTKVGP